MIYKAIIFDWDGTLMNSVDKIVHCMQSAAITAGIDIPSALQVQQIIGISLVPAIQKLFNFRDRASAESLALLYKDAYAQCEHIDTPLFKGIPELLEKLHTSDKILAVATGKARAGLCKAWTESGVGDYFHASRCGDEAQSKPSSDMLQQLLDELNLNAKDAVMIGDTSFDMQMAQNIGMDRVGVSYGVHQYDQLAVHHPRAIVSEVSELSKFLI